MIELQTRDGECVIIVSKDGGLWHLSISAKDRLPTYEELKAARYKYMAGCRYVAQIFPPPEEFVNLHPNVLHLWELGPSEWRG